ncbi:ribosomal RNA large subunit methyltransferase F [Pragia fontium]|uniref:Ribosomal RNA large subunit methyltransferase F n=1 Tax=Pragia fontium TaxID=82985 RepID=A0ABQ5LJD5_9GAMM|nr:23S rRNA (adenine(1618)-N(6))-methyltransferase RlmF [Pragia fontium]GKX63726.1 ribosomal RNA large subunit methyltransferase F [Pragia fontium]
MTQSNTPPKKSFANEKSELHARNQHRQRYDFPALIASCAELAPFVSDNKYGDLSVNFADPAAVKVLNKALLKHFYHIEQWDIPAGYLCPPIPGRADYIHYLADLLAASNHGEIPRGYQVHALDIGVGANCIYPIIGHVSYGWKFVGSDIDPTAVSSAKLIAQANRQLAKSIDARLQKNSENIFNGVIKANDRFDITLCNPPFHASAQEADAVSRKKLRNLGRLEDEAKPVLNFGGQHHELWCEGGEEQFVGKMAQESAEFGQQCFWFTTLVSKKTTLPGLYHALRYAGATEIKTINMAQGQKASRIVAWTFLSDEQREKWITTHWHKA